MNSQTNLSKLFPMIKTKEQIFEEINSNDTLREKFETWSEDQKEDFLSICTGGKGVKMLYDCYFKEMWRHRSGDTGDDGGPSFTVCTAYR